MNQDMQVVRSMPQYWNDLSYWSRSLVASIESGADHSISSSVDRRGFSSLSNRATIATQFYAIFDITETMLGYSSHIRRILITWQRCHILWWIWCLLFIRDVKMYGYWSFAYNHPRPYTCDSLYSNFDRRWCNVVEQNSMASRRVPPLPQLT